MCGGVAAPAPADDHVLLDVVAAADAAVAEDARLVIDGDAQRRVVAPARRQPAREPRLRHAGRLRHRLQLAVAAVLLPRARRRMVRHQHLDQRGARLRRRRRRRSSTFMPGSHSRMQDGGIDARADVDDADAADADRRLVLLVAERRDRDPVQPRGVEDRRPLRDRDVAAVDRERDRARSCAALQSGSRRRPGRCPSACASTSSGKCFMTDAIGTWTTWPRPQMEVIRSAWDSSSIERPGRAAPRRPFVHSVSMSASFGEPVRHGTHLPHDSLRKKRTELSAMSSMQARSSQTTIAPEPTVAPACGHRVPVERQVEHRRRQIAAGRPRRRERLDACGPAATPPAQPFDQLAVRRPHRHFEHARVHARRR